MSNITCTQLGVSRDACYYFNKLITKYERGRCCRPRAASRLARTGMPLQLKYSTHTKTYPTMEKLELLMRRMNMFN